MLQEVKAQERWTGRVGVPRIPPIRSVFPKDAVAVIYRPARSAMTSGKASTRQWKLRFERRVPPVIEPLMGWTAGDDTLAQVELTFSSAEAAVAYARRQGLNFIVQGANNSEPKVQFVSYDSGVRKASLSHAPSLMIQRRLEWIERTLGPHVIRNGLGPGDPAADYPSPNDVLTDEHLSPAERLDVLHRWALNAFQIELALSKGEEQSEPSRLEEVIDALLDLDEMQDSTLPRRRAIAASNSEACAA
jgi:NADH dehydrogenase ubiquinone Fe-S protein 4